MAPQFVLPSRALRNRSTDQYGALNSLTFSVQFVCSRTCIGVAKSVISPGCENHGLESGACWIGSIGGSLSQSDQEQLWNKGYVIVPRFVALETQSAWGFGF